MRIAAFIFLSLLTCATAFPLFSREEAPSQKVCCKKSSPCSSKKSKKKQTGGTECPVAACNPFMSCSNYNQYLQITAYSIASIAPAKTVKPRVLNDNRLASAGTECWHPPNELV